MRYSFRKLFLAKFSLVFFAAAVVFLTACDSPVSLGKKVPLPSGGPEVNIPKDSPESQPGSFLQGSNNPIQLDVDRKNGIRQVEMEIEYYKDGIKQDPKKIPATWDEDLGKYVADIDTSGMDDGQITVRVIAEDNNGNKTITTDIIYTVKNKPSYVAINIPGPKGSVPENVNEYGSSELTESEIIDEKESFPEVVIGDFVLGMFEDIAGLEQGYPQIKVWQGEDEPSLYTDNAGWENVSRPDLDGSEGWVPMDVGTIMSDKVERGGTFRYYLRRRYPDGTYMAKGNDLPISKEGAYHIKLKVKDKNGIPMEWPRDAFSNAPEFMRFDIIDAGTLGKPPGVTIIRPDSSELFQNASFEIEAEATTGVDGSYINRMDFNVSSGGKEWLLKNISGTSSSSVLTGIFKVEIGVPYYWESENAEAQLSPISPPASPVHTMVFNNNSYQFLVNAFAVDADLNETPSWADRTIYIDTVPPETNVSSVMPSVTSGTSGDLNNGGYRYWAVNKEINISVIATDLQGIATEEDTFIPKFKYIFIKDDDLDVSEFNAWQANSGNENKTFGEFLYQRNDAVLFGGNNHEPFIETADDGGGYRLTIKTHEYDDRPHYNLWMYIVAVDRAGNYGWSKILLMADYGPPVIVPSEFAADGITPIVRNSDNPFIVPEKDVYYSNEQYFYGDLIEHNLISITALVSGGTVNYLQIFNIDDYLQAITAQDIPYYAGEAPVNGDGFAVWKTVNTDWNGEIRWRIPVQAFFEDPAVNDGSLSFTVTFEDIATQKTVQTINFFKDSTGPDISVITPGAKVYLTDTEMDAIAAGTISLIPGLQDKVNLVGTANTINDPKGKLIGNFTDSYSPVFSASNDRYWYKLDDGLWKEGIIDTTSASKTVAWQISLEAEGINDGWHRLSLRVKDSLGNGHEIIDIGTTQETDTAETEGDSGLGFETNLAFLFESAIPVLTITEPDPNNWPKYQSSDFIIKGQVTNVATMPSFSVNLNGVDYAVLNGINTSAITVTSIGNTHDFEITMNNLPEGEAFYSITITATNGNGMAQKVESFTLDRSGPTIAYNGSKIYLSDAELADINDGTVSSIPSLQAKYDQIIDASFKDSGASLKGNFSDIYYRIFTPSTDPTFVNNGYWYKIDGAVNDSWTFVTIPNGNITESKYANWEIPLTGFDDGIYRLSLRVKDGLGNGYNSTDTVPAGDGGDGYETNLAFMIARSIPVLSIDEVIIKGNSLADVPAFINDGFILKGQVTDTTAIKEFNVSLNGSPISSSNIDYSLIPSTKTFDYSITVPSTTFNQASNSIIITVTGASDQSAMDVRNFTYDNEVPTVSFISPSTGILQRNGNLNEGEFDIYWSGIWVTGSAKIGGTTDDKNGVERVYYHLGKLNDDIAANDAAREAIYSGAAWTDTLLHTETPVSGWSGGLYYWNYQENLNSYQFNDAMYEKGGTGLPAFIPTGQSRFYLPLYVKVVDRAGNTRVVQYKIYVDPDMDIPQVLINTPEENTLVGGEVRISGTANDNNWVHSVEIRITPEAMPGDAPGFPGTGSIYYKNAGDDWAYPNDFKPGVPPGNVDPLDQGWIKAKIQGNNDVVVAWYYNVNGDGILTPTGDEPRPVKIEVRSLDSKDVPTYTLPDLTGNIVERIIKFDSGVPVIDNPVISKTGVTDRNYSDGMRVSGAFTFSTTITDDADISSLSARITGTTLKELVKDGAMISANLEPGWTLTPIEPSDTLGYYKSYELSFDIDSTASFAYGKTGILYIEIKVYDNQSPQNNTNGNYSLGVDNFYPGTEITTQYNAATDQFYVSGKASDFDSQSGAIQGLERVLVYFERDGTFFNARGRSPDQTDTGYWPNVPAMTVMPNVRDINAGGTPYTGYAPNVPNFANFPLLMLRPKGGNIGDVWESPHAMVIDRQELGVSVDTDEDGTFAEMWEGQVEKTWQGRLDTNVFSDGPLTVHYIVMDQAGNSTHYKDDIYIGNHKPLIRRINLRTDIKNEGANWVGNASPTDYMAPITVGSTEAGNLEHTTGLRVRNSGFGMSLESLYGNGLKRYAVSYVTRNPVRVKSIDMVRGNVYTISETDSLVPESGGGNTEWEKYGAPHNNEGTTFVASGPARAKNDHGDDTTGWAWSYTYVTGTETEKRGDFPVGNSEIETSPDVTGNIVFSNFTSMPDTALGLASAGLKEYDADGNMILLHDKRYIIKVYDSTVPAGTEAEQLAHVALINVDFDNNDTQVPFISIRPFYWNSATDNSVYGNSSANGHIELEADLLQGTGFSSAGTGVNDLDPKVSGQVSFRGTSFDNNTIGNIYFRITNNAQGALNFSDGGATSETTIGTPVYYQAASFNTLTGELIPVDRFGSGWKFEIEKDTHDENGHAIEWALHFDSGFINNVALADSIITVVARDNKPGTANQSAIPGTFTQTADAARTPQYRFDVVPYISEVVTRLTGAYSARPSAFNRSAQGWYPVGEDETIEIKGFNLNGAATGVTVGSAPLNGVAIPTGGAARTHISARVDNDGTAGNANTIVSGELTVSVNSFGSLNNRTSKDAEYNQEPNGLNNNILDDSRSMYVWNRGYLDNTAVSDVYNPFFRMDNNAYRLLSYGWYTGSGTGRVRINRNGNYYNANATAGTNRYTNTTIATGVTNNSWYTAGSNITAGTAPFIFGRSAVGGASAQTMIEIASPIGNNSNRFRIPRIAVLPTNGTTDRTNANSDRVLMSYFDADSNEVKIIYGNMGDANNGAAGTTNTGAFSNANATTVASDTTTSTRPHSGSIYTAVGFLKNGLPVIAWYDRLNQNLLFSYGNGTPTGSAYNNTNARVATSQDQWQTNAAIIDTFKGSHVDMAVDGNNNVHLAYYDVSNGGLYYALIPASGTGTDAAIRPSITKDTVTNIATNITPVKVDTYLSAGTKIMINVRLEGSNYVPYISYAHASFAETRNSIRVAWRSDFTTPGTPPSGANLDDSFTGAWEVMTVPVSDTALPLTDEFVCNGVPTSSASWEPPGGTSTLRNYPTTAANNATSINRTILVGYMTDRWYEGAILKKNLW